MSQTETLAAVQTIPVEELRHRTANGYTPVILDVRTPSEFARIHAVGAILMPLDELDAASAARQCRGNDGRIYVICHAGGRAAKACQLLQEAAIAEVYSIEGGMTAWEKIGLPVVRGRGVISLERQVRIAAGSLVLVGIVLDCTVQHGYLALAALVGAGLIFAGVTDYCGMGILLGKMPWNR